MGTRCPRLLMYYQVCDVLMSCNRIHKLGLGVKSLPVCSFLLRHLHRFERDNANRSILLDWIDLYFHIRTHIDIMW